MWRYVNPRNSRSAVEWKKHAALAPVVRDGDELVLRGEISDHETWLDFLELQEYCDEQFKFGRDLLAKQPATHRLPVNFLNWEDVRSVGFEPIRIRFDFDRARILNLLSEEIYHSDPYVFVRELLQNAIDATATRRERLKSVGLMASVTEHIEISLSIDQLDQQVISIVDQGTGMSRIIIDRYLSVIGSSFYQSEDFSRLKLGFDPISRFGIGIFSCFGVADRVEILTYTDPILSEGCSEAWLVDISSEHGFWKVTSVPPLPSPGTTVRVWLSKQKLARFLSKATKSHWGERFESDGTLRIADYVKAVASFVDIPIVVTARGDVTLIVNPKDKKLNEYISVFNPNQVFRIQSEYPLGDAIVAQDMENASVALRAEVIDLKDIGIRGIEGTLSYLVPSSDDWAFNWKGSSGNYYATGVDGIEFPTRFRQDTLFQQNYADKLHKIGFAPSSRKDSFVAIYRDGLLIPDAEFSVVKTGVSDVLNSPFGRPFLQLNIRGGAAIDSSKLTASRLRFSESETTWHREVFRAHTLRIARLHTPRILELDFTARLRALGELFRYHYLVPQDFLQVYPVDEWPLPFLGRGGELQIRLWKEVKEWPMVPELPELMAFESTSLLRNALHSQERCEPGLERWAGDESLLKLTSSLNYGMSHLQTLLHVPFKIEKWVQKERLIIPPYFPLPPMPQACWVKKAVRSDAASGSSSPDLKASLSRSINNPLDISKEDVRIIRNRLNAWLRFDFVAADDSPVAFAECCVLTGGVINVNHRVGRMIFQIYAESVSKLEEGVLSNADKGKIEDLFSKLGRVFNFDWHNQRTFSLMDLNRRLSCLLDVVTDARLKALLTADSLKLNASDFLPGAFPPTNRTLDEFMPISLSGNVVNLRDLPLSGMDEVKSFGQEIAQGTSWPPR